MESSLGQKEEITTADIQKELFEGENIVIPKRDKERKLSPMAPAN